MSETVTEVIEGAPGSVLAQLQRAVQAAQEEKHLELPVPGLNGLLVVRYRPLGPEQMDRYVAKRARIIDKGGELADLSSTDSSLDLMAQACVCLLAGGEPLEHDGSPVRFDARLADVLNIAFPPGYEPTAREVILRLFGQNAMSVDAHASRLLDWMRDPEAVGLGESPAGG
ncbi:MAG TPA: hypothetical protein VJN72_00540 [Gaiellales bacterium]|nr:hypothetical protein [Gaiellales bacterium]